MSDKLDELRKKRDQLNARIQHQEARLRAGQKKSEDRVKLLIGVSIIEHVKAGHMSLDELLGVLDGFLVRPTERAAVLGDDRKGSDTLRRLTGRE